MTQLALADPWQAYAAAVRRLPDLVEALRGLPWPAAAAALLAGAAAMGFGARSRRPLAAAGGGLVGFAAGVALAGWLGGGAVPWLLAASGGALALGVLAGLYPPLFIFAAGALPGALVGSALPATGQPWYGLLGLAVGGLLALGFVRWVAAVAAAGVGAALLAAGFFGAAGDWAPARVLASHPLALVALLAVLTVSGAAFQHATAWRRPRPRGPDGTAPEQTPTPAAPPEG
ncbi:MAG TPA: hypothetical protein VFI16_10290 [Anaeromyxobacteraceae bacterium]|nr:hypothetical protein [Anaeromyxobacteraceae bacterium]